MSLGERIRIQRKEKKLTQKGLAEILGIDHTTISKWESNIYEPDSKSLSKLAEIFEVSTDYLLGSPFFVVDYSKAYNPFDIDGSISHFIDLLFVEGSFSQNIQDEIFELIEEIKEINNLSEPFKIDLTKRELSIKDQLKNYLDEFTTDISIKYVLLDELKQIASKYHLWKNDFYSSNTNSDLNALLSNSKLTFKGQELSQQQKKLIKAYLDALTTDN